jgi:hypothetical protein
MMALIAVAGIVVAIFLWIQQVRIERAWQYASDLPTFHEITAGDLAAVFVPVNRKFEVVTDAGTVIGKWTVHPVGAGEMVHPSQITDTDPDRFRFDASGQPLPEGVHGYFMEVPEQVLAAIEHDHYLSVAMADGMSRELIVLFDKARVLEESGGGVFLGLTMSQIAAIEGLKDDMAGGEDVPLRLVWTITQGANPDLPPLAVFDMGLTEGAALLPSIPEGSLSAEGVR